jgi:signal peptidase II
LIFFVLICFVIGIDQLTKGLIVRGLALHQSVTVLPGVLSFTRINNPGAAFGILQNRTIFLMVTPLLLFFLVFLFRKELFGYPLIFKLGLAFCLGGAAGNLIDRIRNGGRVIDFIDLDFWPLARFPVFNLADGAIFIGAILIICSLGRIEN